MVKLLLKANITQEYCQKMPAQSRSMALFKDLVPGCGRGILGFPFDEDVIKGGWEAARVYSYIKLNS